MKRPTVSLRGLFGGGASARPAVPAAERIALPELVLRAERIAAGLAAGRHGRRRSGTGEDFWQFRQYQAGEPATAIDWRQSARNPTEGSYWVRERERENAQSLLLWCDPSLSMDWRSSEHVPSKSDVARLCTLALAGAALRGGERAGLLTGPETGRTFAGKHVLPRLAEALTHATPTAEIPDIPRLPGHADLVIVSDFLWDASRIDAVLGACARHPVRTHLLCVLDPAERHLPYSGRIRFDGLEGGTLTLPAVESLGTRYAKAMDDHLAALQRTATAHHMTCVIHDTGDAPDAALLALVSAMGAGYGR